MAYRDLQPPSMAFTEYGFEEAIREYISETHGHTLGRLIKMEDILSSMMKAKATLSDSSQFQAKVTEFTRVCCGEICAPMS